MTPHFLITNDDGILSPGLTALAEAFAPFGRVITVAPDREMSATSHRITVHQPLRYHEVGPDRFAVEGSPADCVILGCLKILEVRPTLVISGVNRGVNLGDDINYSGTVSAAFEAALQGVPAIAVSTSAAQADLNFAAAARIAARISERVLSHGLPPDVVLNVNYPHDWNGSVKLTRQGRQATQSMLVENRDPRGREYFWLHEKIARTNGPAGSGEAVLMTDFAAVSAGYVSVSPLHLDRTAHGHVETFSDWMDGLGAE